MISFAADLALANRQLVRKLLVAVLVIGADGAKG